MNPLPALAARLAHLGPWAPLAFIAVYIVGSVAFIPGAILSLVAGAVFGLWRGAILVFVGAVLGSLLAFALARRFARRRVAAWLAGDPRAAAVQQAMAGRGLTVVLLLRLSPVIPFNALNYALGVTDVGVRDYLIGSIGMVPGTLLYTYSGAVIGDVARVASGVSAPKGPAYYVLLVAGLAATAAVTIVLTRTSRAALARQRDR